MAHVVTTVKSSAGDYSSLIAWESGEQTNLVTDGNTHEVQCDAFNDLTSAAYFALSGWTVDATHYVTIQGMGNCGMPWSNTATYTFTTTYSATGIPFNIGIPYTEVYDIQVHADVYDKQGVSVWPDCTVDRMVVRVKRLSSATYGFQAGASTEVRNLLVLVPSTVSFNTVYAVRANGADPSFLNCMAYIEAIGASGTAWGFSGESGLYDYDHVTKNCVAFGATAGYDFDATYGTPTTCATDQASADSGLSGTGHEYGITDNWTDSSTYDFRFTTFAALKDAGTDLSASFLYDIMGNSRGGNWNIGVYEFDTTAISKTATIPAEILLDISASPSIFAEILVKAKRASMFAEVLGGGAYQPSVYTEFAGILTGDISVIAEHLMGIEGADSIFAEVVGGVGDDRSVFAEFVLDISTGEIGMVAEHLLLISGDHSAFWVPPLGASRAKVRIQYATVGAETRTEIMKSGAETRRHIATVDGETR